MVRFECDYAAGAHPKVLQALVDTNLEEHPGYGTDPHCDRARALLRDLCQAPDAHIHFLVGGTQANTTVISAALRPHQGVICAQTGHINVHESGAVEATGHKVLTIPSQDGKLTAHQIAQFCQGHYDDPTAEHTVQPGLIYLSHPTELGTVYSVAELEDIRRVADQYHLTLFVDGARLVYGLAASDVTLPDLARLCDVFYLGGTKAGTLFGEAVVITQDSLKQDFRYLIKRHGGLLAKGRLLGVQFEALLEDGLYLDIGCAKAFWTRAGPCWRTLPPICSFLSSPTTPQRPCPSDTPLVYSPSRTRPIPLSGFASPGPPGTRISTPFSPRSAPYRQKEPWKNFSMAIL